VLRGFPDARVVIVDDNPEHSTALQDLLERGGLQKVYATSDPAVAVDLVRDVDADLLMLDLQMPEAGGYTVLEQLSSRPSVGFVPVIVLTGDSTRSAAHRALILGANDFITKPFDETEVVLRVRNLLQSSDLFKALRSQNVRLADELERRLDLDRDVARHQKEVEERVARVIDGGDLSLVFQPIVEVPSGDVVGFEALSRFPGPPQRSPDLWFNEAAAIGRGPELEMVAVRKALGVLDQLPANAFVGVNVSPQLVMTGVLEKLCDAGMCPRLVFELTEHVAVSDYAPLAAALAPLRARGARIAVDDAGAGYATLHHVLALEPDIIKLDRSLTAGVDIDAARRALASALIGFAGEVSAELVAEGIETGGELEVMTRLGANLVQGFYIARPAPLAAAA
jgi:EAL domain-containing protein (putative c-di-GMP-specific phosphodiesterase class I)